MPTQTTTVENNLGSEVSRKLLNLITLLAPVVYYFSTRELVLQILYPLAVLSLVFDLTRYFFSPAEKFYLKVFGVILREYERKHRGRKINGVGVFLLTAIVCTLIFPKYIMIVSFAIFSFADIASALVGRRFGRRKFNGRSLEGCTAFMIAALLVIAITPKIEYSLNEYLICSIAAFAGAGAEVLSYKIIDDNFAIPVATGVTMWLLFIVYQPTINLHFYGF